MSASLELPEGWPDGPLDEVLGELLAAGFKAHPGSGAGWGDPSYVDVKSPPNAHLDGRFDLRVVACAIAPDVVKLFFNADPKAVAARIVDLYGREAMAVLRPAWDALETLTREDPA